MAAWRFAPCFAAFVLLCWCAPLFPQTTFYSRQTGAWSALATWSLVSHSGAVAPLLPGATDTIIVGNGHTLTLDVTTTVADLRIVNGTLQYDNVVARILTVNNTLRIENTGIFTVRTMGAGIANALLLRGNVVNNGTWTMRPVANSASFRAVTAFLSPSLQTITGAPILTRLNQVLINKGSRSAVVDCAISLGVGIPNNIASSQTLDFFNSVYGTAGGTWRQRAGTITFDDGITNSSEQRIETPGALHIVGTGTMIFGQNGFGASLVMDGGELLFNTSSSAPSRIGIATGNSLLYTGSVDRSSFVLQQGIVEVAGRFARNNPGNIISYRQSGGTLLLCAAGSPSIAGRGMFEIVDAASEMAMSGGLVLVRNANASASLARPADVFIGLGATATMSGGTIQFSDQMSLANQRFDWNVPTSFIWANLVLGSPSARLFPFDAAQNLRLSGNFVCNGTFDGTQTRTGTAVQTILTLQGINTQSQILSGFGSIVPFNLTLNRQNAGSGTAVALLPLIVRGTVDFQEAGNTAPQVLELGANADLTLTSTSPSAIEDAGETRSIRTRSGGGSLWRALAGSGDYLFPLSSLGSSINPEPTYTPLVLRVSGASGQFGVNVHPGSNTAQIGAHRQIPPFASSYIRRLWQCQAIGVSGAARIIPAFPSGFGDIAGSPVIMRLARYRPNETVSGNTWLYADTNQTQSAAEWSGDWTYIEAQNRTFFSRSSGLWTDAATWSFLSHTGAAVPVGIFPSRLTDSVIIGGGINGAGNHVVSLNTSVTLGAAMLGSGIQTTGTLECTQENRLSGGRFVMGERSTLRIGAPRGIEALPTIEGNITTTLERRYIANAQYEYIGAGEQVLGTGLPNNVYALRVAKPVNSVLRAERSVGIWQNLSVASGVLDAQDFFLGNTTTASAMAEARALELGEQATLRIGGSRGFADATTGTVRGFAAYNLHERSTVEFYGDNQVIEPIPAGAFFGNVLVSNIGRKTVWNPCVVRGNLRIQNGATLTNNSREAGLRVFGTVSNSASLFNNGVLDIGQ